jgi:hypothetical protein
MSNIYVFLSIAFASCLNKIDFYAVNTQLEKSRTDVDHILYPSPFALSLRLLYASRVNVSGLKI